MKITDVCLTLFHWNIPTWKIPAWSARGGAGLSRVRRLGIVAVETDEGVTGHCFLGSPLHDADTLAGSMLERLKPALIGEDPFRTTALWTAMWRHHRFVSARAIGAIDVALWDLKGKALGQAIHRLIGTCRDAVPAYPSSACLETPEQYAEEARRFQSAGFTAYKIHPHGTPEKDIEICRAVRSAVGDRMTLMLDAMWAYGYEDALRVGRAIEDLGYFWYEDPLHETDIYSYVKLHSKLDIPLLATEYAPGGYYAMASWITEHATDMLRGDVAVTGGITPLLRLAHLADGFHMKCEIHHGGNSLNNAANLHVMLAIDNCDYYELFPANGANKYGLVADIKVDHQGLIHAPQEPGLGYDIDWELVRRETIQEIR